MNYAKENNMKKITIYYDENAMMCKPGLYWCVKFGRGNQSMKSREIWHILKCFDEFGDAYQYAIDNDLYVIDASALSIEY